MLDADVAASLLAKERPGPIGLALGRLLRVAYRLAGVDRYDSFRMERVAGVPLVVIPSVANPKLLRTGAFFAEVIDAGVVATRGAVLDMGTGSGVCAVFAARRASRVIAVDINRAAVRCTRINAALNALEDRIDVRHGDLFEPVGGEQFDAVLFNPPFFVGPPADERDAAWRSIDLARRFAAELGRHLRPRGAAYVLLSSIGDACVSFEQELRANGFRLEAVARKRFVNEVLTLVHASRPETVRSIDARRISS